MGDLSLVRHAGFAALHESAALRADLEAQAPQCLAHGVHVIAVQSADGTLEVGDSHHDDGAAGPSGPAASEAVDALILSQLGELLAPQRFDVVERWVGHHPVGHDDVLVVAPGDAVRVVVVTSGTGASTGFAIGEEVCASW